MRTELAPAVARAIVRTDARERGDAWLDETPFDGKIAGARFEDDERLARPALSSAMQMKPPASDVDQASRRRKRRRRWGLHARGNSQ